MNGRNAKPMRLFFGLWPDPGVRDGIATLTGSLSGGSGRTHHPDDLHITLVFLGAVAWERVECVERAASNLQGVPAFEIRLNRIEYWKRPRILLLAPEQVPLPLLQLVRGLQQGLGACGFEPEQRPYRPHITLVRKARPHDAGETEHELVWRVRDFVLAGSVGGDQPPRYQVLRRWALES